MLNLYLLDNWLKNALNLKQQKMATRLQLTQNTRNTINEFNLTNLNYKYFI